MKKRNRRLFLIIFAVGIILYWFEKFTVPQLSDSAAAREKLAALLIFFGLIAFCICVLYALKRACEKYEKTVNENKKHITACLNIQEFKQAFLQHAETKDMAALVELTYEQTYGAANYMDDFAAKCHPQDRFCELKQQYVSADRPRVFQYLETLYKDREHCIENPAKKSIISFFLNLLVLFGAAVIALHVIHFGLLNWGAGISSNLLSAQNKTLYEMLVTEDNLSKTAALTLLDDIAVAKDITAENGKRIESQAGVRREILLAAQNISNENKSKIDMAVIQPPDSNKQLDYGNPNFIRAIETYRTYTEAKDGEDNLKHFSKNFDEKQKALLSVIPQNERGTEARRMALLADKTLSAEEKQAIDVAFFGGDYTNPQPSKTTYAAFKERAKGTASYDKYVYVYNEAVKAKTKGDAIRKFVALGLSFESAAQLYTDLGIKHARNYGSSDKYYASVLNDSQFKRVFYVESHMGIEEHATYYMLNKIMLSGGKTKKKQVQALMDYGLSEDEAYQFYELCHVDIW